MNCFTRSLVGTIAVVLVCSLLSNETLASISTPSYSVTILGSSGVATGINDNGEVVGYVGSRGFVYVNGAFTFLATIGGGTQPNAISNSGIAVGFATDSIGGNHPFESTSPPAITDLGSVTGYTGGGARAINASGEIAGFAADRSGSSEAAIYSSGQWTDLGYFGTAWDVNDSDVVVGQAYTSTTTPSQAFVYANGNSKFLGTLGGTGALATGINNSGQIVGTAGTTSGNQHAFVDDGSTMSDLGVLPGYSNSYATAINQSGVIVGYSYATATSEPFIYSGGQMTDLNSLLPSGSVMVRPMGFNDVGQIVGYDDRNRPMLLTPVNFPEPRQLIWIMTFFALLIPRNAHCRKFALGLSPTALAIHVHSIRV